MSYFTNLIYQYGIFAMFFIILIEYACFPISSEIVLPFSGAVASLQNISFLVILPLSVVAGLIGTSFCYIIGRIGGLKLIERIIRRFPKTEKGILSSQTKFQHYGGLAVCFGRLIPICRTYIAFIAGAAGQKYPNFLLGSVIGITLWNTLLIGLGYLLHDKWKIVGNYYERYKDVLIPLLLLIGLYLFVKARKKNH
ncbi:MAG: associated Golgi protein [Anaerocolumna sp.]|jgi:membrane protein DedA with SNARE-associated domain|nr:associated Golgi protein [Anaerocolumna sp.]